MLTGIAPMIVIHHNKKCRKILLKNFGDVNNT